MDQGIAAVLAGVGALIGSAVGALAAWRGARIGAQKAVEAVRVQVEGQSEAEHRHWAREERKNSWMAALRTARLITNEVHELERHLRQGRPPATEGLESVADMLSDLAVGVVDLSVWGPEEGADACADLYARASQQVRAVLAWAEAASQGQEATREIQAYEGADERRKRAYVVFLHLARESLRDAGTP